MIQTNHVHPEITLCILSDSEIGTHFKRIFDTNKEGDPIDYVFEIVRREMCELIKKRV